MILLSVLETAGLSYSDVILTIIALIVGSGIPWAYIIERRLAVIETESKVAKDHEARLRKLELLNAASHPTQVQEIIDAGGK